MLLGAFSTYTELTARVDKDVRHWQNDFYVQDNWRATSRLTLDYGVRFQHSGSDYEVNNNHTGFFADTGTASQAGAGVPSGLHDRASRATRPAQRPTSAPSILPIRPCSSRPPFNGNIVPGTGTIINGISTDGISGAKDGTYFRFPYLVAAPRFGIAWNVTGDGKTAIRASTGHLLQLPAVDRHRGLQLRRRLSGVVQQPIRYATFDDIAAAGSGGGPCACCRRRSEHERRRLRSAAREVLQRQRRVPARHRLQHHGGDRVGRQLPVRGRPHRRHQPAPAVRVREPGEPREQRAAEQQLAESRSTVRTRAWDR